MNIIHLKYAVEVALLGSISKASESLAVAQPNISRAIKDLESELDIAIFDRTAKGMTLTADGKDLIARARAVLSQIDEFESAYKRSAPRKQTFSLSAPRAAYIAEAFAAFTRCIDGETAEIVFDETGTYNTIKKIISSECKLGIIRYDADAQRYFEELLRKNGLESRHITDFRYTVITSAKSPLATKRVISEGDLTEFIQITHTDPYEATLTASDSKEPDLRISSEKRIYLLDSAAQLELLAENSKTFMWMSPLPEILLDRYGLVQIACDGSGKLYRDTLIYRKNHKFSMLDNAFIDNLTNSTKATAKIL